MNAVIAIVIIVAMLLGQFFGVVTGMKFFLGCLLAFMTFLLWCLCPVSCLGDRHDEGGRNVRIAWGTWLIATIAYLYWVIGPYVHIHVEFG